MEEETLIYDIETRTFGKPDSSKDRLRIFGCYSYKTKKTYLLTKKDDIQNIINAHKYLVGFNNVGTKMMPGYDNPILIREGINLDYKIFIDLRNIFKNRASQMKIKKGMLGDLLMKYKLDYIVKMLGIVDEEHGKIPIDYTMFQKETWSKEELTEITTYTKQDILITKKLYEWVEKYFEPFKPFLNEEDVRTKKYLTCSIAVFAYKAICKALNIQEEYDNAIREEKFGGGYVAYPAGEIFENVVLFDYTSLYPNMFIQANLFGRNCDCCSIEEKWHGDNFFKVEGYYCSKKLTKLSKLLQKFYTMRVKMKAEKNPAEYSIKIIINSSYGAISNPTFKNIYDLIAAKDCTALGRQIIKYTRKRFREEGFLNIMTDTDSVAIQLSKTKTRLDAEKLAIKIVEEIQKHLPFPW